MEILMPTSVFISQIPNSNRTTFQFIGQTGDNHLIFLPKIDIGGGLRYIM